MTNLEISNSDLGMFTETNLFNPNEFGEFKTVHPEEILDAFEEYKHMGEDNPYGTLIERAGFMKRHGLEPVFMVDESGTKLLVTSEQHLWKRLN